MAVKMRLLWMLCAIAVQQINAQGWETPYFERPDNALGNLEFDLDTSGARRVTIRMDEEVAPEFTIAKLTYTGTTAPTFSFNTGNNAVLGLKVVQPGGAGTQWQLVVTKKQDADSSITSFSINVLVNGDPTQGNVLVSFKNINDNAPVFEPLSTECSVPENFALNKQTNCLYMVRDVDKITSADVTFEVVSSTGQFKLEIVSATGDGITTAIVLSQALDYETISVHMLELKVSDKALGGDQTGTITVILRVTDIQDTPPTFTKYPLATWDGNEEQERRMNFIARDGDTGIPNTIEYEIMTGDTDVFSLASNTVDGGVDLVMIPIDRDTFGTNPGELLSFDVTIRVYEKEDPTQEITQDIVVLVTDLNDNDPKIEPDTPLTANVDEGKLDPLVFTGVDRVVVKDPDLGSGGQFSISLEDGDVEAEWAQYFMVVPTSGYQETEVSVSVSDASLIDFETLAGKNIELVLKVTERRDPTKIATVPITVVVNDLKDEPPQFELPVYESTLLENVIVGETVVTVKATDGDAGDVVTYRIVTTTSAFTIDGTTGVITTARTLNFEQQTEYTLQVEAKDLGNLVAFVEVKVTVGDVNDVQPTLEGASDSSVEEHSLATTEVTRNIKATDPDLNAELVFSIDWAQSYATQRGRIVADPNIFKDVVTMTTEYAVPTVKGEAIGVITVTDADKLNWENFDILYLMIVVEDINTEENNAKRQGLQAININNKNDNPPLFNDDTVISDKIVVENTKEGQLIGYVVATDPDVLGTITYSIAPKTDAPVDWIRIDEVKGELRTSATDEDPIDVEFLQGTELYYIVTASDGELTTSTEVLITVVDTNDNLPVFVPIDNAIPILENSPSGTSVVTLEATDIDFTSSYKTLYFELNNRALTFSKVDRLLSIDPLTGDVTVDLKDGAVLDREAEINGELTVNVVIKDNQFPPPGSFSNQQSITVDFVIKLLDENDEQPVFQTANIPPVLEDVPKGRLVYTGIYAPDKDEGVNGEVTYRITQITSISGPVADPPLDMFKLVVNTDDKNKVDIYTDRDLRGLYGIFSVTIEAIDGGPGAIPVTSDFRIEVTDVNDNDPIFVFPTDQSSIRLRIEQTVGNDLVTDPDGTILSLIEASDVDDNENGRVTFEILGDGTASEYFEVREGSELNKARLLLKKPFIPEMPVFDLVLRAVDHGESQRPVQSTTRVYIIDNSDQKPRFDDTQPDISWTENETGLSQQLPLAVDPNNIGRPEADYEKIYYYIGGVETGFGDPNLFSVDPITNLLTLNEALDHETFSEHRLIVVAANTETAPSQWEPQQELKVKIIVGNVPDSIPTFSRTLYVGGITPAESSGYEVLRVAATDPDGDSDALTYNMKPNSISASQDYLEEIMNTAFEITSVENEAIIKTNFIPQDSMEGYFTFTLVATDRSNNAVDTLIQIYIISSSNRVFFLFINNQTHVEEQRDYITSVFTKHLGFDCSVDGISAVVDPAVQAESDRTQVRTHFIDSENKLPVPGSVIEGKASNYDTLLLMQTDLRLENLELIDVLTQAKEVEDNLAEILTIVLIVVSVVLGALVIILFVGFILKTRSLNRRLKALSTTRFGSQESGLNRLGMNAPNTNKHAIEGSNPVWNEDIANYDNQSNGSGDSELIGVEDRPEFGYGKDSPAIRSSQGEAGYYSGSDIAAAAAAAAQDQHIASTEL